MSKDLSEAWAAGDPGRVIPMVPPPADGADTATGDIFADACLMRDEREDPFANPQPVRHLLRHVDNKHAMFPAGYVTIWAGPGGVRKSTTALQVLIEIACGRPSFADYDGKNGYEPHNERRMFYWAAEDQLSLVKWRMCELIREMKLGEDDRKRIAEMVIRHSTVDSDTNTRLCAYDKQSNSLVPTPSMDGLRKKLEHHNVGLLVIDPFTSVTPAELETDNNAAHDFMRSYLGGMARDLDLAVLVLHHTVKGVGKSVDGQDAIRGASGIVNGARSAQLITKYGDNDEFRLFKSVKENLSPEAKPFCLKVREGKELLVCRAEKDAVAGSNQHNTASKPTTSNGNLAQHTKTGSAYLP